MVDQSPQGIAILGSTGTIGVNTLDVIRSNPGRYRVVALSANQHIDRLLEQCLEWHPDYAVVADSTRVDEFVSRVREAGLKLEVLHGVDGLCQVAALENVEQVMAGIVGAAGLLPSLAAARAGKRVLLANKEALVISGPLFMKAVEENHAELLPIDSEHNAIFQCMPIEFDGNWADRGVSKILLTASGGPFRTWSRAQLVDITPEQACKHQTWVMGRKISVDSATMMNKGLELIEACWLFNATPKHIQVVIHPQSIIHSMVSYSDGSVLAQMGNPDMRTPIAHAMAWPERTNSGVEQLDIFSVARLDFEEPDEQRFPALRMAREAWESGGLAAAVLNAANEEAVGAFLNREIRFSDIESIIEQSLDSLGGRHGESLDEMLAVDDETRRYSRGLIHGLRGS